jgi:hypothetical protein
MTRAFLICYSSPCAFQEREVRSYEAEYVGGLFHWDAHLGSRKVLTPRGEWLAPILFGVFDDGSSRALAHWWSPKKGAHARRADYSGRSWTRAD